MACDHFLYITIYKIQLHCMNVSLIGLISEISNNFTSNVLQYLYFFVGYSWYSLCD